MLLNKLSARHFLNLRGFEHILPGIGILESIYLLCNRWIRLGSSHTTAIIFLSLKRQADFLRVILHLRLGGRVGKRSLCCPLFIKNADNVVYLTVELAIRIHAVLMHITFNVTVIVIKLMLTNGTDAMSRPWLGLQNKLWRSLFLRELAPLFG